MFHTVGSSFGAPSSPALVSESGESCVLDRRMPLAARVTPVRTRLSSALSSAPMRGRSSFGARRASSVMDGTEGMREARASSALVPTPSAEPPLHRGARVRHARVHRRAELAEREGTTVGSITGARSSRGGVGTRGGRHPGEPRSAPIRPSWKKLEGPLHASGPIGGWDEAPKRLRTRATHPTPRREVGVERFAANSPALNPRAWSTGGVPRGGSRGAP